MTLTHISLFSGIGGDSLAAEWAGFEHLLFCEIDPFCQKVLNKKFPGVPIIGDVHDVTRETIANTYNSREQQPQGSEQNIGGRIIDRNQTEIASNSQGVKEYSRGCGNVAVKASGRQGSHAAFSSGNQLTLLTAGVPCQPASAAGKRLGKADNRWLWPEAIRVLSELKPTWAVFENPAGIRSLLEYSSPLEMDEKQYSEKDIRDLGLSAYSSCERYGKGILDEIVAEIESKGYEVQPVCIPACGVGAPHRRERIFIIAHALDRRPQDGWPESGSQNIYSGYEDLRPKAKKLYTSVNTDNDSPRSKQGYRDTRKPFAINRGGNESNTNSSEQGLQGSESRQPIRLPRQPDRSRGYEKPDWNENWIEVATRFCRVDARVSDRVHRLKALGNAIVPQQIYPILKAIEEIEANKKQGV